MTTLDIAESRYYVCDYCAHVETVSVWDDRPARGAKCEACRMPLDIGTEFDTLDDAERYSAAVAAHHAD